MSDATAVWFGARGFDVLRVIEDGFELVVEVETTKAPVGCPACGVARQLVGASS